MTHQGDQATQEAADLSADALPIGMPNVPAMARFWDGVPKSFTLDAANWIQIAPADPSRWLLSVSVFGPIPYMVWIEPDPGLDIGFSSNGGTLELPYSLYGLLVCSAWYAFGGGATSKITVFTNGIRLR